VLSSDDVESDDERYPNMDYYTDQLTLNDNLTIPNMTIGVPLQDWAQQGYHPMMAVGLGEDSVFLNLLKDTGAILSRTWSMFYGWNGHSANTQSEGTFVVGGYDRAKVSGEGHTFSLSPDRDDCDSRILVNVEDMILNFRNGTTASMMGNSRPFEVCIVPDYPVLMTMPLSPYFDNFQSLTQTDITERTFGIAYYSMLYSDGDEPFDGDMTISIRDGPAVRIPNHQLIVPNRYIDSDTGAIMANESAQNLVILPLQGGSETNLAQIGRQFLSAAYLMVNQDTEEFTLWNANPTSQVDLVAVNENGDEVTEFCEPEATTSGPSSPAETGGNTDGADDGGEDEGSDGGLSTGAIAGIAVGAVAAIGLVAAAAFLMWRRRKRETRAAAGYYAPPAVDAPKYGGVPTADPSPQYTSELSQQNYYMSEAPAAPASELSGSGPQRPHYEMAA
jgi:hypothetical protein